VPGRAGEPLRRAELRGRRLDAPRRDGKPREGPPGGGEPPPQAAARAEVAAAVRAAVARLPWLTALVVTMRMGGATSKEVGRLGLTRQRAMQIEEAGKGRDRRRREAGRQGAGKPP